MSSRQHPNPNPHDDPAVGPVVMAGVVGTLIVVAIVIALVGLYYRTSDEFAQRVNQQTNADLQQLRAGQLARLNTARWVDKQRGVVAVPIERAIELTARELAASRDGRGPWSAPAAPSTAGGAKP